MRFGTTIETPTIAHLEWSEFRSYLERNWRPGEHVSTIGPTGAGKTTLNEAILALRKYVVILATKPADESLDRMLDKNGGDFHRIDSWPPSLPPRLMPKVIVWPKWKTSADTRNQQAVMGEALDGLFAERNWTFYVDELFYLCEMLHLRTMLRLHWTQGRSLGLSLVGSTQRPAWVPLEMYSQATHVMFFRQTDKRDLDRIQGLVDLDPATIRQIIRRLPKYVFLYINTRTGEMFTSKTEAP